MPITYNNNLHSGSALGAVKLQNFIPWDIDIDIYLRTEDIDLFKPGGPAYQYLTSKGIEIYRFQRDNYSVKNAGSFNMWYGGEQNEAVNFFKILEVFVIVIF